MAASTAPCVSVIIPSLHAPSVAATIASLRSQHQMHQIGEVLVVGLDGPGVVVEDGWVRLIDTGVPVNAPRARNIGMAAARFPWLAMIDADCVAEPDWLGALLARTQQGYEVVGSGLTFEATPYWTAVDNLSIFAEALRTQPAAEQRRLSSHAMLVSRRVMAVVGPMDEGLPRGEDMDWTMRIRRAGVSLFFEPAAVVWHRPPRATRRATLRHWWLSGYYMRQVRQRHQGEYGNGWLLRRPLLLQGLAPPIAALATLRTVRRASSHPAYSWRLLPAIYLTKLVWCLGAAFQPPDRVDQAGSKQETPNKRLPD